MGQVHENALRVSWAPRRASQGTARVGDFTLSENFIVIRVRAQIHVCCVHVVRSDHGLQILSLSKRPAGEIPMLQI